MSRTMKHITTLLAVMSVAVFAVTLEETPDSLTVLNSHYAIKFAKNDGYVGRFQTIGKTKVGYTSVTPILFHYNKTPAEKINGCYAMLIQLCKLLL